MAYEGKGYKFRDMQEFISPFARDTGKEQDEEMEKQKDEEKNAKQVK